MNKDTLIKKIIQQVIKRTLDWINLKNDHERVRC